MRETICREMIATLGGYVRETRKLLGWSQQHLADAATVSQGMISRIEGGQMLGLPFLSVVKVLTALAREAPALTGAVSPSLQAILDSVRQITAQPVPAPDPELAHLILQFQALTPTRRDLFLRMLQLMGDPRL